MILSLNEIVCCSIIRRWKNDKCCSKWWSFDIWFFYRILSKFHVDDDFEIFFNQYWIWLSNIFFLIDATKFFDKINMIDKFLIKKYWFVIVVDYENENENVANVIDNINKFELSFYEQFWIFQKCVDFAHDNLIKTFNAFVHLKIFNNKKFHYDVAFFSINRKNIFKKFIIVVNS